MPDDPSLDVRHDVPLGPMTTLEIGGPARHFCEAVTENMVVDALRWADRRGVPVAIVGGGSNLVVADDGFDGLAMRVAIPGFEVGDGTDAALVSVAAGEPWDEVVARTVEKNLAGLECLSGIPGSAGATPIQNVGAYGQEVSSAIVRVSVIDRVTGRRGDLAPQDCEFGYRSSRFKREPDRFVVLGVTFRLIPGGSPTVRYRQLEERLATLDAPPGLAEVRSAVLDLRRSKSMVIEASDANRRSVGSFFVNPTVTSAQANRIQETEPTAELPRFPAEQGNIKIPAAWLIERCGFWRGMRRGAVGVSSRHSLALVHHGGGTAEDLIALARDIRDTVRDRFGIDLQPEPTFLGFSDKDPTAASIDP
jgi:UDP-N-acetylmuramate dehydrogenase